MEKDLTQEMLMNANDGITTLLLIAKWLVALFILLLIAAVIAIGVMYVIDKHQTRHTIRRNFPVIGRFRYLFEHVGEFFRLNRHQFNRHLLALQ